MQCPYVTQQQCEKLLPVLQLSMISLTGAYRSTFTQTFESTWYGFTGSLPQSWSSLTQVSSTHEGLLLMHPILTYIRQQESGLLQLLLVHASLKLQTSPEHWCPCLCMCAKPQNASQQFSVGEVVSSYLLSCEAKLLCCMSRQGLPCTCPPHAELRSIMIIIMSACIVLCHPGCL